MKKTLIIIAAALLVAAALITLFRVPLKEAAYAKLTRNMFVAGDDDKFGITLPILSDIDTLSFKTLGILNKEYQPGDSHYGIPYPGMIIIDTRGVVVGKLFLEGYSSRVDSAAALAFARAALGLNEAGTD